LAASFALVGFWASQLTGSAGGATLPTLPGFSFPATTIGVTSPIATIAVTTPSPTSAPATTAAATTSAPATSTAAAPAPDPKPAQVAAASPGATTAPPSTAATPTTAAPRTAPRAATPAASASRAVSQEISSPRTLQQERQVTRRPRVQTTAPPTNVASPAAPAAAAPALTPQPVPVGPVAAIVRTPDAFPWPLAVAATAGGIGLLAAALGLLGVIPLVRRGGWETCEIALRRSDGDGDFYARPVGRKRDDQIVRSPMFRLHSDDPLANDVAILAAHNALVQRLSWDGWEADEARDGVWWKHSFHRPTEAAAAEPAAPARAA
jgi:hypothetical protein